MNADDLVTEKGQMSLQILLYLLADFDTADHKAVLTSPNPGANKYYCSTGSGLSA